MIDPKTLFPMVKNLLPNESDQDIMAGIQAFAQENPDLDNKDALQALITAIKEMQGGGQPTEGQPAPQAPAAPAAPAGQPFEGLMGQLGGKQ